MFTGKYGPFAETVTIAAALLAVFSLFLLKMVGRVSQWTWLVHDSPSFMVTAGARALAVALIALSFIFIDKTNYGGFAGGAVLFAIIMFVLIGWFDKFRKAHLCKVPLLNADGSPAKSFWGWGKPKFELLVIGDETNMNPEAARAYKQVRAVSLCGFMSGYGRHRLNDAAAIWSMTTLAKISNKMTIALMGMLLCAVMALYLVWWNTQFSHLSYYDAKDLASATASERRLNVQTALGQPRNFKRAQARRKAHYP